MCPELSGQVLSPFTTTSTSSGVCHVPPRSTCVETVSLCAIISYNCS